MKRIYLDNSATTRVSEDVMEAMKPYFTDIFGNPSSIHSFGQEARLAIDKARKTVAGFLNCDVSEIIFTSGGTESDNLAIKGVVDQYYKDVIPDNVLPHIITTAFEHHAVLNTVKYLEKLGKIEATYVNPDINGLVDPKKIAAAIKENTILISVMYVNNEIGTIQPIKQIGELVGRLNAENKSKIFFHTDAVQAAEFCPMDVKELDVDLLTMTAHKIHGPKGVGVLFVKKGIPIKAQSTGGDQEFRIRAGTENVAAIVGLAAAVQQISNNQYQISIIEKLRDKLETELTKKIPNSIINGKAAERTSHISNTSFINAEGEAIILNLDMEGIAVSSGSACTSGSLEPSHVLTSMGIPAAQAHGSIRFSLSRETTVEEIDRVIEILPGIIEKLRQMSPIK